VREGRRDGAGRGGREEGTRALQAERKAREADQRAHWTRLLRSALGEEPDCGDGRRDWARRLVESLDLAVLSRAGHRRIAAEGRLDSERSRRLEAIFELGRRVEEARWARGDCVRSPGGIYRLMAPRLRGLEIETFYVLLLDGKHRLRDLRKVSEGTLTTSLVHPREVFRPAIRESAAAVVAVHNHPSGDPEPSSEDLDVTRRLAEAGRLLGIPLLDHVVVGQGGHVSIRERIRF